MRDNIVLGDYTDERRVNVLQVWMLSLMKSRALKRSVMMQTRRCCGGEVMERGKGREAGAERGRR